MGSDTILELDQRQSDPATARVCKTDPKHGRLTAHVSGVKLCCLNKYKENGKLVLCSYEEPVSR